MTAMKAWTGRSLPTPAFNYRSRKTLRRAPWWSHAPLAWRLQRNADTALFWRGEILEEHKFVIRDCFALAKRKHYISGLTARLLRIARQLMGL